MIRLVTCLCVLFLVACGTDAPSTPTNNPTLMSLWPVDTASVGTKYAYDITKVKSVGSAGTKTKSLTFEVGRMAPMHFVGGEGMATAGASAVFEWTARGLELSTSVGIGGDLGMAPGAWATDGLCITAMAPNLLLLPAALTPGTTHACGVFHNMITMGSMTWVGPNAVTGHPNAHKFTSVLSGPYMGGGVRAMATSWRVTIDWILSPSVGPVQVTCTEDFLDASGVAVDRVTYTCNLTSVTPGP